MIGQNITDVTNGTAFERKLIIGQVTLRMVPSKRPVATNVTSFKDPDVITEQIKLRVFPSKNNNVNNLDKIQQVTLRAMPMKIPTSINKPKVSGIDFNKQVKLNVLPNRSTHITDLNKIGVAHEQVVKLRVIPSKLHSVANVTNSNGAVRPSKGETGVNASIINISNVVTTLVTKASSLSRSVVMTVGSTNAPIVSRSDVITISDANKSSMNKSDVTTAVSSSLNRTILPKRTRLAKIAKRTTTKKTPEAVLSTVEPHTKLTVLAIGMGITMKKVRTVLWDDISKSGMQFLSGFLVSFCHTASPGFHYRFYLAYDDDDKFFRTVSFRKQLSQMLLNYVSSKKSGCPESSRYSMRYVECPYQGKPAWAQNDAMIAAYAEGAEYFFRVNDDTVLISKGWSESYIKVLENYTPSHIGVVGPNHKGGNRGILTYDFVHRSHIEIFGFYYPRLFPTWYGDHWITKVYLPGRMTKVKDVTLRHTMTLGKRYPIAQMPMSKRLPEIEKGKETLIR